MIVLQSASLFCQTELKLELDNVDCLGEQIQIDMSILIRSNGGEYELMNQNYRVDLGLSGIIDNSLAIKSEGVFSGFGTNSNGELYLYQTNTILGSKYSQLSYNIDALATFGYVLNEEWSLIGSIRFLSDGTEDCFDVRINKPDSDYFSSQIEILGGSGKYFMEDITVEEFSYCLSQDCEINGCPDDILLESGQDDIIADQKMYEALNSIIANNSIRGNASAIYSARQEIVLLPNFEIEESGTFEIILEGCSN